MSEATDKLVALALAQVGAAYVWGMWGDACTPGNRRKYAGYTPDKAALIKQYCPMLSGKQSACTGCKWAGKRAFDCRGLTQWCLKQAGVITLTGQGANSQYNTSANWTACGAITSMPDLTGMVLFRQGSGKMQHTGLYIGGGLVVEAAGHKSGVILSAMPGNWTHWAAPRGLYGADEIVTSGGHTGGGDSMRTLRKGATGADVTALQTALVAAGQLVDIDGKFGAQTKNAVIAFQQANGLTADGIVGALTWAALGVTDQQTVEAVADEESTAKTENPSRVEFEALRGSLDALTETVKAMREELDALKGAAE